MKHGTARQLLSDTAWLTLGQVIVRGASLLAFPLLANSVEAKTFGLYQVALQLGAAWAVLASFQLRVPLVRYVAREEPLPDRPPERVVGQVLALRLVLALLVLAATAPWALTQLDTPRERLIFELLLAGNLVAVVAATFDEALQARSAFRPSAVAAVAQGLTVSGGILLGVAVGRQIAGAVTAQMAGAAVYLLLAGWQAARHLGAGVLRPVWSRPLAADLVRLSFGIAVGAQIGAWYGRIDLLAVRRFLDETAVGQYSVPFRALEVTMTGVIALHAALLPRLVRAQAAGPEALAPRLASVLRLAALLLLPFAVCVSALAGDILAIFKPEYAPGSAALAILIWMAPLVFAGAVLHWVMFLEGRPWTVTALTTAGLVANTLLCWLLVPRLGLLGAASARLCAECCIVLPAGWLVSRRTPVPWGRVLVKPALMAAAMAGAFAAWPAGPWWGRLPVAAGACLLAGVLLRPLDDYERELLAGLLHRGRDE